MQSINQCDSIVHLQIEQFPNYSSELAITLCEYQEFDFYGNTIVDEGTYYHPMQASNGCDSTEVLTVSKISFNTDVSYFSPIELTSHEENVNYHWFDCNTMTPIPNANNQNYVATENGLFALVLSFQNCFDTTSCYPITELGLFDADLRALYLFPNPSTKELWFSNATFIQSVQVFDIGGQLILMSSDFEPLNVENINSGLYFIDVFFSDGSKQNLKFVKR